MYRDYPELGGDPMALKCFDRDGNPLPADWEFGAGAGKVSHWATDQRVGRTVVGDCIVSTVWLFGIDHGYRDGEPPIIFETMIFGEPYHNDLRRYATEEQAMRGHLAAVDNLRAGRPPFTGRLAAD
jgi:hypothetical protein